MFKILFITTFLFFAFVGCKENNIVESFNYERDTPVWLKEKIDSMSIDQYYFGSEVYRYKWHRKFTFEIFIPLSSCAYCDIYDENGIKKNITDNDVLQDYLANRRDKVLVWEWKK